MYILSVHNTSICQLTSLLFVHINRKYNQCLSLLKLCSVPTHCEMYLIQFNMIKLVIDLWKLKVIGFYEYFGLKLKYGSSEVYYYTL